MSPHIIRIGEFNFTHVEFEILKLVMRGMARKEIAATRGCSLGTVDTHMRHIHQKTKIHKVTELMAWGFAMGFDHEGNYTEKKG